MAVPVVSAGKSLRSVIPVCSTSSVSPSAPMCSTPATRLTSASSIRGAAIAPCAQTWPISMRRRSTRTSRGLAAVRALGAGEGRSTKASAMVGTDTPGVRSTSTVASSTRIQGRSIHSGPRLAKSARCATVSTLARAWIPLARITCAP